MIPGAAARAGASEAARGGQARLQVGQEGGPRKSGAKGGGKGSAFFLELAISPGRAERPFGVVRTGARRGRRTSWPFLWEGGGGGGRGGRVAEGVTRGERCKVPVVSQREGARVVSFRWAPARPPPAPAAPPRRFHSGPGRPPLNPPDLSLRAFVVDRRCPARSSPRTDAHLALALLHADARSR